MDKRKRKNRRYIWLGVGLLFVAGIIFVFTRGRSQANADALQEGEVVTAVIGDLSSSATASGQILPEREAQLALGTTGIVEEVYVKVGEVVDDGDALLQLETDALSRNVANVEQNLAIQEANLAELMAPPTEAELASAQAAVASSQANLDELLAGATPQQIASQESALRTAEANVASSQAQLEQAQTPSTEGEIEAARASLNSAQASVNAAYENLRALEAGASEADIASARSNLLSVQQQQQAAQDFYDDVFTCYLQDDGYNYCPKESLQEQATTQLNIANENLNSAQARLNDLLSGASAESLAQARANLASASAQRDSAQANLDKLLDGSDENTIKAAEENLNAAIANREAAQAALDSLLEGSTEAQLATARSQLAQAQANLEALQNGATAERTTIAEAQVAQARISLEEAQANLEKATLRAPFNGMVTAIYVAEGELASGVAVAIVDLDSLAVVLSVDEIDLGNLVVGQPARITLDAYPDLEIDSEIIAIAPAATSGSDSIVSYEVRLGLSNIDANIYIGMTANASLETSRRENVLLVPNAAIKADRQSGTYSVNLVTVNTDSDFQFEETEVQIGLRDNRFTEIVDGLSDGDELLIGDTAPRVQFGPPGDN